MPRPISEDMRSRMVAAVEVGGSRQSVALRFAVAPSTVIKLMQAYEATGSVSPKPMGGYKKHKLKPHREVVLRLVSETPDATLDELVEMLRKRKILVSRSALARYLGVLELSFKKNSARQRARPA
jgi:transposase